MDELWGHERDLAGAWLVGVAAAAAASASCFFAMLTVTHPHFMPAVTEMKLRELSDSRHPKQTFAECFPNFVSQARGGRSALHAVVWRAACVRHIWPRKIVQWCWCMALEAAAGAACVRPCTFMPFSHCTPLAPCCRASEQAAQANGCCWQLASMNTRWPIYECTPSQQAATSLAHAR